eukprot:8481061-Heterocapsa_arctica.AAC.1
MNANVCVFLLGQVVRNNPACDHIPVNREHWLVSVQSCTCHKSRSNYFKKHILKVVAIPVAITIDEIKASMNTDDTLRLVRHDPSQDCKTSDVWNLIRAKQHGHQMSIILFFAALYDDSIAGVLSSTRCVGIHQHGAIWTTVFSMRCHRPLQKLSDYKKPVRLPSLLLPARKPNSSRR